MPIVCNHQQEPRTSQIGFAEIFDDHLTDFDAALVFKDRTIKVKNCMTKLFSDVCILRRDLWGNKSASC
jgi:hypothetical protein